MDLNKGFPSKKSSHSENVTSIIRKNVVKMTFDSHLLSSMAPFSKPWGYQRCFPWSEILPLQV